MTTVQLVGWDEAKCRPIYRHRQAPLPSLEQQQRQSSFVDINIHPPPIIKSSSLVVSRKKKNKKATKIAMNTAVADSSSHDAVVPGRRKRRDRAILSNYSSNNRQHHERVSLSPSHNIIVTAAASSFNLYHHRRLFNNNNNNNNNNDNNNSNRNNYHRRVSFDAATRWTKTRRRYGKNDMGVSSNNNNNNMSYTHEIVDDVIFVIDDSFAILPPAVAAAAAAAVVNCNDGMRMMMEDEEGGEDLVFNENNDGQEGRATTTIDESSRSSDTSTSLLHGNRDGVGKDCDDRRHRRRRKISHDSQRIHREIDPLMMVDHPLRVDQYQCESDHPELDEVTNSKSDDVEFPEIVQHADELVIITTPSSKKQQRGEEQRQLTDSFSNENESEEDDERYYYELDEYDTPSIFNPTIEDAYLIQGDENVKSQLHNTAIILTQDDDDENTAVIDSTGFDDHFAIDETGSTTSRIHPSKGERRRGSTYGDGKPVWKSSKLISSESTNGPRGKIIVGWDDDKGRPIYRTTACESNSLSTNIDDPCLLPSTRSLDESEVKNSTIPKQKQKKKKVYATLFKKTGLSQAVRDEMDIDPPLSLHC